MRLPERPVLADGRSSRLDVLSEAAGDILRRGALQLLQLGRKFGHPGTEGVEYTVQQGGLHRQLCTMSYGVSSVSSEWVSDTHTVRQGTHTHVQL